MNNPGVISLEQDSTQILANEGSSTVDVTIIRSQGSDGTITVDYRSVENSSTADLDYISVSGTAVFNDGELSQTISIPILEDNLVEGVETFNFTIDNVTGGGGLLAPRTAFITIEDNDFIPEAKVFNGNQYLFTSTDLTWQESQAEAASLGGNLVTINDSVEEVWLRENFSDTEPLWIGINDSNTEGTFHWSSGQPVTYTNWADGEPNDFDGIQDFGLMNFFPDSAGEWDDESGTNVLRGIIEIGGSNPTKGNIEFGKEPIRKTIVTGLTFPTAIDWAPDGNTMFIAEKAGVVKTFSNGQLQEVIDISSQVNDFLDRGLIDIAVHPDFFNGSPYLYAAYTYDPPEVFDNENNDLAGPDGSGNRAGRVGRFTVDVETLTIVPNSEEVILGRNSTWENFNGFVDSAVDIDEPPAKGILDQIPDFLAADSTSHSVGALQFGPDGALYVSNGDGTSFNVVDPRTIRVQDLHNLSGKILRIDPITGEALTDNPYYDGDSNSNRSKIYQYGLRNPFRFNIHPETGVLYIGDVGWGTWEEVNVGEAGANFGWPYYEGGDGTDIPAPGYEFFPEAQEFYNSGQEVNTAILALNHNTDNINAIVMGDLYTGNNFPVEYQGDLFFNDLGQGIVRNISFDDSGAISDVEVFADGAEIVVQIVQGPDENLYFVDLDDGIVGRWEFEITDVPPRTIAPIADLAVSETADDPVIDLSTIFIDDNGDELTYSVQDNSNEGLVSAVIDGSNLNLALLEGQFGTADITVRATANGQSVDDTFTLSVDEPLLSKPIYRFQSSQRPGNYLFVGENERQSIHQDFADTFHEEGLAFNAAVESNEELIALYRFQSIQRPGTYIFVGEQERNNINNNSNFSNSFAEEGIAFYAHGVGAGVATPFHRFQNSSAPGTYIYAAGAEADNIRATFPNFIDEGTAFEAGI
ncbi:glucose/sorbosone dehydrogenase [Xenococcus sp. PCC 7305]|uniref:PQQ-dependent sugar dehydrogenase n=1 Tax=Xenococcus sp. PCC 7305 TaxID=102125 RepID=UPI0002ABB629|nr:PQQ-dependent sugar dehydrogenase [Xenococcus sp. PCC 7305]ELS04188.1 glucose/sorbosone dehydrogenase [Xenococcus sp. PCC 7305]